MVASRTVAEAGFKAEVAAPLCWVLRPSDAPRLHNPFELDDDELAAVLADLPAPSPADPRLLAALEEAEVPSLWLL